MSEKYNEYLTNHKNNVYSAFKWLERNLPELFDEPDVRNMCEFNCRYKHDESKTNPDEYQAYDNYFYGDKSYDVVNQFERAWLKHIHRNPHHWQHWVLINDNPDEGEKIIDMPDIYIIEMICDWMSFAINKGDLRELLKWYEEHEKYMKLSDYTRMKVNEILEKIDTILSEGLEKGE